MNSILITGGDGFIAKSLRKSFLQDKQHSVCVPSYKDLNVCDFNQLKQFLSQNKFDIVIHTAIRGGRKYIKPDSLQDFYDNLISQENLLHFKNNYSRLICFSSGAENNQDYDISDIKEGQYSNPVPTNYYALSKYINTQRARAEPKCQILKLFNVFGPLECTDRFITTALRAYIEKRPIEIYHDIYLDFFYIEDLYSIVKYSLDYEIPKELNCCYLQKYKMSQICEIINNLSNYKVPIIINNKEGKNYNGDSYLLDQLRIPAVGICKGIEETYKSFTKE